MHPRLLSATPFTSASPRAFAPRLVREPTRAIARVASKRVGVLALQGGFAAHARALADLGHVPIEVRAAADLAGLDGLILPGGESTVHLKLIDRFAMGVPLDDFVATGRPVLGTCAGLILAARRVTSPEQPSFGWIDVAVARNAYGRQRESFEAISPEGVPLIFIRGPRIIEVGPKVEVLATLAGEAVLVRDGNVTGASFHPELTADRRVHGQVFGVASLHAVRVPS
jgi:pyridoxal 5'-phosphate synthase pdxT subunit